MLRTSLLLIALALPSAAQDAPPLRGEDRARLDGFEASAGEALLSALRGGSPDDVDLLTEALSGQATAIDPVGDWSCRTMKLGKTLPLTVYPAFRCRVMRVEGEVYTFEKLTGSQRTRGIIAPEGIRAIYRGTGYVDGGPAVDYAGLPEAHEALEPGQTHAQVAVVEQTAPDRLRMMFPDPYYESKMDILWLTR